MKLNDRVLHRNMKGCTDAQRAGEIVDYLDGGYAVKWIISYPSGLVTHHTAWYEPQELIPFVEAEIETADNLRELVWSNSKVIDKENQAKPA